MKETNEKSSAVHDQPQSLHNSSEKKHALKSRISSEWNSCNSERIFWLICVHSTSHASSCVL